MSAAPSLATTHPDIPTVEIVTTDGVTLATDVCLPTGAGPFPTVLIRTPYDRRHHRAELRGWAAHGFAALAQDVRGRHASGGDWQPYTREAADGATTARWLRQQPWSSGQLVAAGGSYAAYCALALALYGPPEARPDAVLSAVPALGQGATAREVTGCERLLSRAGWWAAYGDRSDSDTGALSAALRRDPALLDHLPLTTLPRRLGRELPGWHGLWAAPAERTPLAHAAQATMPLLAVGGSHDSFRPETLDLWRAWGGPSARLLLGPWGHGLTSEPGSDATKGHRLRLGELYARWARAALEGTLADGHHGAVALGDSAHWLPAALPTSATHEASYFFREGAGRLRLYAGREFTADPWQPVRSDDLGVPRGVPADRCVLATPPLPRPVDLWGEAALRLRASASTPVADWLARLVALSPDGVARVLATGMVRHRASVGRCAQLAIPMGWLSRRLPAGTRLRLEVAGHHFPAHARNPHTGQDPLAATELLPSVRVVSLAGSVLLLPRPSAPARIAAVDPAQEILR